MADYHILEAANCNYQVILHFAVPDQTNSVGVGYREIIADRFAQSGSAMPPGLLSPAELLQLETGELAEETISFMTHAEHPIAQDIARLEQLYNERKAALIEEMLACYKYYGYAGTVN